MCHLLGMTAALVVALFCLSSVEAASGPLFAGKNLQSPDFSRYVAPAPESGQPLDFLDKLYKKLDDIKNELQTAAEMLDGLEAQLGQLRRQLSDTLKITFGDFFATDDNQDDRMDRIAEQILNANTTLDALKECLTNVTTLNDANLIESNDVLDNLGDLLKTTSQQKGDVASLKSAVPEFKSRLLQTFQNEFDFFSSSVAALDLKVKSVENAEAKSICESGVVSLDADDRRAEYLFQNSYGSVPIVTYSLSSYTFLLDTRPTPKTAYGSYLPWNEPNILGVMVYANPSPTGVTFEKFNLAFGDTANHKVTVSFMACSISSGTESVH